MNKQLIYKNQQAIDETILDLTNIASDLQAHLQPIFDVLEIEMNIKNLTGLRSDPNFFPNILVPDDTSINGLAISKRKIFEMMDLTPAVKNAIAQATAFVKDWDSAGRYLQYFETVNGEIKIKEGHILWINEQYSYYVESERALAVYNAAVAMQGSMQIIAESVSNHYPFSLKLMRDLFKINDDVNGLPTPGNSVYKLNHEFFRSFK